MCTKSRDNGFGKKGFTLIELLVVISIIAVLLSVLMPALTRAKYIAKRLICSSHVRSQAQILFTYASGNDGKFPVHNFGDPMCVRFNYPPDDKLSQIWEVLNNSYVTNGDIFECPAMAHIGGYFKDSTWHSPAWPDEGGWDAVYENNVPLEYLFIGYGWFANYRPNDIIMMPGEEPWPDKLEECNSKNGIIAHLAYGDNTAINPVWNLTHGGNQMVGGFFGSSDKLVDNPVGHGDGSVKVYKESEMAPRGGADGIHYYWY